MATITDVCNALISKIAQTVYPSGTAQPSIVGAPIRVYEGWPNAQALDSDLQAGAINVSIFPSANERNTTRFSNEWKTLSINATTLSATVANQTISIGGTITTPQNVGAIVNNVAFIYAVQASDTLTTIATGLAALISASISGVTSSLAVITIPAGKKIQAARIGSAGLSIRELRRQERVFQISIWANTPQVRDGVADPIDVALAAINFLTLTDGTMVRLIYKNSPMNDSFQKANLYRRDLNYQIEYATTQTAIDTVVTVVQENVSNQPDGASAVITSIQINS